MANTEDSLGQQLPVASQMLGRVQEGRRIAAFLGKVTPEERVLLLEGEVGIGKSTLLRWSRAHARSEGYVVLAADLVELDLPREYGCIAELLGPVPSDVVDNLAAPLRSAIHEAVLGEPGRSPVDPRTVATAMIAVLEALTSDGPVLLSIDDLPYMDISSQRVLSSALRRAGDAPIKLLTTFRTHWDDGDPGLLMEQFGDERRRLTVGPLGARAIGQIISLRMDVDLSGRSTARVRDLSAGNPLFALELMREGSALRSLDSSQPSLTLTSLGNMVRKTVTSQSSGARDVLLVAALVSKPTQALLLAAAADPATALRSLDEVKDSRLIAQEAGVLTFAHPLIRSTAVASATAKERREAHRRLASVVSSSEDRARHLGLGAEGADEDTSRLVEEAAVSASSRGAPEAAAALAELATLLTPAGRDDDRTRRVRLEARARFHARELDDACSLLQQEQAKLAAGPQRAQVLREWARYAAFRGDALGPCLEELLRALDEVGDDQEGRAEIAFDLAGMAANAGEVDLAKSFVAEVTDLATQNGNHEMAEQVASADAYFRFSLGEGVNADLVEAAISGHLEHSPIDVERRPRLNAAHILHLSDDLDLARTLYESERATAIADGMESALPMILWGLVETEIWAGEWSQARAVLLEGWDVAEDAPGTPGSIMLGSLKALLSVLDGAIDAGLEDAESAIQLALESGFLLGVLVGAQALGLAGLSRGDPEETCTRLAPIVEQVVATGIPEPGFCHFVADDIEARIRLGDLDGAEKELIMLEQRSGALNRRWGLAAAGRCRALLCSARGRATEASEAIASALQHHGELAMPFEQARTLMIAGEIHRRARRKRQASEAFSAAATTFERLGAPLWRQRAAEERARIGIRPARGTDTGSLTEAEIQVAELAVKGLGTADIAKRLFMSQRTVQSHLTKIYRKTGVRSRTQLVVRFRSEHGRA